MIDSKSLQTLLTDLMREVEALWSITRYRADGYAWQGDEVRTEVQPGTAVLPKTKRAVRGTIGVRVATQQRAKNDRDIIREMLSGAMFGSTPQWLSDSEREREDEGRKRIGLCLSSVFDEFGRIANLNQRIFESIGCKHYEPDELAAQLTEEKDPQYYKGSSVLFIAGIFAEELILAGFDPKLRKAFQEWEQITARATERILSFAGRERNRYDVFIFLNGPSIDEESSVPLGTVSADDSDVEVSIGYASDELLERFNASSRDAQLSRINTVISFRCEVSTHAPVDSYLQLYVLGGRVAERVVDCLRLIRHEDIGVLALEVFPMDRFTPWIRKTYEQQYQPELALYVPKRFSFEVQSQTPLDEGELSELRLLFSSYSDVDRVKGLRVAFRRFRSSCERFEPFDPERLLDIAFSFEAMFLNDGDNKELNYRLSSRVARFLGNTVDKRLEIFDVVKTLYNFRSKIAHGETLDKMRKADAEKVKQVLEQAPRILTEALRAMVLGQGPTDVNSCENLSRWWKRIELG